MGTETPLVDELIEESLQQNQKIQGQKNVNTFGFYHDKDKGKIGYDADKYIDYFGDEYDIPVKLELDYSKNRLYNDMRASAQGMSLGTSDEIEAFLTSLASDKKYSEILPEVRQKINNYRMSNPGAAITSEILGSLLTGKAFVGKTPTGTFKRVLGGGTVYGGGAADPQADPRLEEGKDLTLGESARIRTEEATRSALWTLPFAYLSRIMQPTKESLSYTKKGGEVTPGQIVGGEFKAIEDVAEKLPLVGTGIKSAKENVLKNFNELTFNEFISDLNNALKRQTLVFPKNVEGKKIGIDFKKIPETKNKLGNEMFSETNRYVNKAYDRILEKLVIKDKKTLQNQVDSILNNYEGQLPIGIRKQLNRLIFNRFNNNDELIGESLKRAHSQIRTRHRKSGNSTASDAEDLHDMYGDILDLLSDNIAKYNPTTYFQYSALDKIYPKFLSLEKAIISAKNVNYYFSPQQLINAGISSAKAKSAREIAKGNAPFSALGREAEEVITSSGPKDVIPYYAMGALAGGYTGTGEDFGEMGMRAGSIVAPLLAVGASYRSPKARRLLSEMLRKSFTTRVSPYLGQQNYFGLRDNSGN
jgi:hypothetical protein